MMEKRLRLGRRLLKPSGVLICTIDEHAANHLGMLLEKIFPRHLHYMITIVINPKGREKANFAPVEEFAFFAVPDTGTDIILRSPSAVPARPDLDDIDNDEGEGETEPDEPEEDGEPLDAATEDSNQIKEEIWEYRHARRRGGGAESSSYREKRPNQFYPIYINEQTKTVVRAGASIPLGDRAVQRYGAASILSSFPTPARLAR